MPLLWEAFSPSAEFAADADAGVISNAAAPFGGVKQSAWAVKEDSKASRNTSTPRLKQE
ncbi:MAG: hypothetical protein NVSMB43_04030 [Pseudarthrobacter sp.]